MFISKAAKNLGIAITLLLHRAMLKLCLLVVCSILLVSCGPWHFYHFYSEHTIVSPSVRKAPAQVQIGWSAAQVREFLNDPVEIRNRDGQTLWYYISVAYESRQPPVTKVKSSGTKASIPLSNLYGDQVLFSVGFASQTEYNPNVAYYYEMFSNIARIKGYVVEFDATDHVTSVKPMNVEKSQHYRNAENPANFKPKRRNRRQRR